MFLSAHPQATGNMTMPMITIDGGTLSYDVSGAGPPIVFVAGLGEHAAGKRDSAGRQHAPKAVYLIPTIHNFAPAAMPYRGRGSCQNPSRQRGVAFGTRCLRF